MSYDYIMRRARCTFSAIRERIATGQIVSVSGENKTAATASRARTRPTAVEFGRARCGDGGGRSSRSVRAPRDDIFRFRS